MILPERAATAALLLAALAARATAGGTVRLVDATATSGLSFRHAAGASSEKHLPETMGAGVALLDADGDGDLDAYLVQGRPAATGPSEASANELWLNTGEARFVRSETAGSAADRGLGMGVCWGDVDEDGDPDLFVTNVGEDALHLNDGRGRFHPGPAPKEGWSDAWSTSCTFVDVDGDGHLDLHVISYVDHDPVSNNPYCGRARDRVRVYCHPDVFSGVGDRLYSGDGHGTFTDVTLARGLGKARGKGLGVVAADLDGDGDPDLVVANDGTPNFLWRNDGRGHFREVGLLAGLALNGRGEAEAGMGVDVGDVDGDGILDVVMSHLDLETTTLWTGRPGGSYRDSTPGSGLDRASLGLVGFGLELYDADMDGDSDLLVVNGHVIDNIAAISPDLAHAEPDQLLLGDGRGRFRLLPAQEGGAPDGDAVSRGLALGDLDADGDLDAVITVNDGPPRVLLDASPPGRPMIVLELEGTSAAREAIGATVEVRTASAGAAPGRLVSRGAVRGGRSYLSQGTYRLHLAAPPGPLEVTVRWPFGGMETFPGLAPGGCYRLREGRAGAEALALRTAGAARAPAAAEVATPP